MDKDRGYKLSNFKKGKFKVEALYKGIKIGETNGSLNKDYVSFEYPITNNEGVEIGGFRFNNLEDESYKELLKRIEEE